MGYSIEFRPSARRALEEVPKSDQSRLVRAIDKLSANPFGRGCKKVKGTEFWRARAGDYRVIYTVIEENLVVIVVKIGHRREVYR